MNRMRPLTKTLIAAAIFFCTLTGASAQATENAPQIGTVNFKICVETSTIGKQEQASFESLRKQMESFLEEKDKNLNEIAAKFNDRDYMDSLSTEAENELRHKFRTQSQELAQLQNQYYQTLNQTNFKIVQKMSESISKAAETVAKQKNLDLIVNDETLFYTSSNLDVTKDVITEMDKNATTEAPSAT